MFHQVGRRTVSGWPTFRTKPGTLRFMFLTFPVARNDASLSAGITIPLPPGVPRAIGSPTVDWLGDAITSLSFVRTGAMCANSLEVREATKIPRGLLTAACWPSVQRGAAVPLSGFCRSMAPGPNASPQVVADRIFRIGRREWVGDERRVDRLEIVASASAVTMVSGSVVVGKLGAEALRRWQSIDVARIHGWHILEVPETVR